jgi:hypothetical protein
LWSIIIMKHPRRKFLYLAASAAALPVLPRIGLALDYPTRPVHIIVGFAAGSTTDILDGCPYGSTSNSSSRIVPGLEAMSGPKRW